MRTTSSTDGPSSVPPTVPAGARTERASTGRGDDPAPPSARTAAGTRAAVPVQRSRSSTESVDAQLARVAARLLAEVAGDPVASAAVQSYLAVARARFADATVTQFVPILVEREVRRRLREGSGSC